MSAHTSEVDLERILATSKLYLDHWAAWMQRPEFALGSR